MEEMNLFALKIYCLLEKSCCNEHILLNCVEYL